MATEIAKAYVQIVPSMQGIGASLTSALSGQMATPGNVAGIALGNGIAMAATKAISAAGGFFTGIIDETKEFDSAMSQVAATLGYTVEQLNSADGGSGMFDDLISSGAKASEIVAQMDLQLLNEAQTFKLLDSFAQEMGATTTFSAQQAAEGLNYMALAGYDAQTAIEMLPIVLDLAKAGGMELAYASDMITDAQSALGLSIADTVIMVDQMAMAASKSNTSVAQLGEAILRIGANARDVSGGTQELTTALGILANNGIKGAEGGTHLRNVIRSLQIPTTKAKDAMESLGFSMRELAYDTEGNLKPLNDIMYTLNDMTSTMTMADRSELLSALFNPTDLSSVKALLVNMEYDTGKLTESLEQCGIAWDSFAGTDAFGNAFTGYDRMIDLISTAIYNMKQGIFDTEEGIAEFVESLSYEYDMATEDVEKFTQTFLNAMQNGDLGASNWDALADAIGNAEDAASNMGAVMSENLEGDIKAFESALSGVKLTIGQALMPTMREFVQIGSGGLQAVTEALKAGDMAGAFAAIGDMATEALLKITDMAPQMITAGAEIVIALGKGLSEKLPEILSSFGEALISVGSSLAENLPIMVNNVLQNLGGFMTILAENIRANAGEMIPAAMEAIVSFIQGFRENFGEMFSAGLDLLMALAGAIIDGLPAFIESIPDIVINIASLIVDNAPKLLFCGIELIAQLIVGIVKAIPTLIANIPKIFEAIWTVWQAINWVNLGTNLINAIKTGIQNLAAAIPNALRNIGQNAINFIRGIDWLGSGSNIISSILNGIMQLVTAIPNAVMNIGQNAMNSLANMDWVGLGKNIISGLANGIKNMAGSAVAAVSDVGSAIVSRTKSLFKIKSPSRVFEEIGGFLMEGLADGVDAEGSLALDSVGKIANGMTEAFESPENWTMPDISTGSMGAVQGNATYMGGVTFNIQASDGMDVEELAYRINDILTNEMYRRGAAYA